MTSKSKEWNQMKTSSISEMIFYGIIIRFYRTIGMS